MAIAKAKKPAAKPKKPAAKAKKPAATSKATKPAAKPMATKPAAPVQSSTLKKPRGSKHRTIREAAQFGSTADVQLFLDAGWPADAVDTTLSYSVSALGMACFHRKPAIVRQLLAAGADPNLACGASSPLLDAVASGSKRTLEMVQMLLDAGANPKTEGYRDMSLVAWVARDPKLADVHAVLVAALKSRA
ncbi:MAG: ankyrin repeat domain-containing protein [Kofleriaceae bacterium]